MKQKQIFVGLWLASGTLLFVLGASVAMAKEPCGALGECKVLVEINSSDGDIGFHFLMDGDDFTSASLKNPGNQTIFKVEALRDLREQTFTETFIESAEPLCFDPLTDEDPENDQDDFRTLEEFLDLWSAGTYKFVAFAEDERAVGRVKLTFHLPAAPKNLNYDDATGVISWTEGNDLGECATQAELWALVAADMLPRHPKNVQVAQWEIVFEADVEPDDPSNGLKFTVRVPGDIAVKEVTVPAEFLASFPNDTPAKFEIGAIGLGDNATFTEEGDVCVNEVAGCVFE